MGFRFCPACGLALESEPAAAGRKRKTVTVLFSDIVGSTLLGEALDTEVLDSVNGGTSTAAARCSNVTGESRTGRSRRL